MRRNVIAGVTGAVVLILVLVAVVVISREDKTGPKITVTASGGQEIVYKSGEDKQDLIRYARAVDKKDGDVSDTLMIEEIYISADLTSANVIYVARDRSNNITKFSQQVKYVPGEDELEDLKKRSAESANQDVTQQQTTSSASGTGADGKDQPAQSVAASVENSERPVLTLTQNDVTVDQGAAFNPVSYIKEITDKKDDKATLFRRVVASGSYSTAQPGDYTVTIYCTNTQGNKSNPVTLNLHVKEKRAAGGTGKNEGTASKSAGNESTNNTLDTDSGKENSSQNSDSENNQISNGDSSTGDSTKDNKKQKLEEESSSSSGQGPSDSVQVN